MIKLTFNYRSTFDPSRLLAAVEKAQRKVFAIAAARIRKRAVKTIHRRKGPSPPGRPPHTHRGLFFWRAVRFHADEDGAVIGPVESVIGPVGRLMEFGGTREGAVYPPRPTMGPALLEHVDEYGADWESSIGP